MELRQRVRRRLLWLRLGQSLLAGAAGALAAGLTAAAEGLAPMPLALCAALLMMALVLLVGRPWIEPELAVDPRFDADGLLRTALCTNIRPAQQEALGKVAAARPVRLRPLPDWQAWSLCLGLAAAGSGWVLLEPESTALPTALGAAGLRGLALDGRPLREPSALTRDHDFTAQDSTRSEPDPRDGEGGSETGQWQRVGATDDGSALRLGLDLGLEQAVYERYLRNLAKHP